MEKTLRKVYIDLSVIAGGFAVLTWLTGSFYLLIPAGIAVLAAVTPTSARWVSAAWRKLGKLLGTINGAILLTLFFCFFITPFSLLYRLFNRKTAQRASNWADTAPETDFRVPY